MTEVSSSPLTISRVPAIAKSTRFLIVASFSISFLAILWVAQGHADDLLLFLGVYHVTQILLLIPFVIGVSRIPHGLRKPWMFLLVSQILVVFGDLSYNLTYGSDPTFEFPSPSDIIYGFVYLTRLIGLIMLARRRSPKHDFIAWIDAVLISLTLFAFIMVFWSAQLQTVLSQGWYDALAFFVSPAMGMVTVGLLVRLAMSADRREPALLYLLVGQFFIFSSDVAHMYTFYLLDEHMDSGLVQAGWLIGYAFMSMAALRPDAKYVGMESHQNVDRSGNMYGWFLFAAIIALSVPILGFVLDPPASLQNMFEIANILVVALVLARAALLLRVVQQQAAQLSSIARSDALTGLPNRRTWDFEIKRAIEEAEKHNTDLWVAVLDMDHFKKYNDTLGHAAGDELLTAAGQAWQGVLPESAFLSRYGGEEFGVLIPGLKEQEVFTLLNKLRVATPNKQTTSIGAARVTEGDTALDVFRRADLALYEAKRTGRNRVIMHSDSSDEFLEEIEHDQSVSVHASETPTKAS